MKLYRVGHSVDCGNSGGFSWHSSSRSAKRDARTWDDDHPDEPPSTISVVEVEPTKRGIIRALNLYASHPDNG